jgi:hypothetical protein
MADVTQMPSGSFGYVPTPALVAPIEFTLRLDDYQRLGGHMDEVRPIEDALEVAGLRRVAQPENQHWPTDKHYFGWSRLNSGS